MVDEGLRPENSTGASENKAGDAAPAPEAGEDKMMTNDAALASEVDGEAPTQNANAQGGTTANRLKSPRIAETINSGVPGSSSGGSPKRSLGEASGGSSMETTQTPKRAKSPRGSSQVSTSSWLKFNSSRQENDINCKRAK